MRPPKRSLIVDVSNLLFRVAAVQKTKYKTYGELDAQDLVGLCMHVSIQSIYKWYRKYRPDFVVFAFEGGDNWRKEYTLKANLRRQYKANRVRDPEMAHFFELITSFKEVMTYHTSVCCLSVPGMEADDCIGAYVQSKDEETEAYVISGDTDFVQLLRHPKTYLVNPDDGKLRNQPGDKKYEPDIDYWMFLKCVRGDTSDNVPSAYPRVLEKKIRTAYESEFDRVNFMNARWADEHGTEHRVGDLYQHNSVLMDLTQQPDDIKVKLAEGVASQLVDLRTYSHFHFLKFLGEFKLKRVGEEASKFIELFTSNQRYLRGEKLFEQEAPAAKQEAAPPPTTKTTMLDF